MIVHGDYHGDGYARIEGLLPAEACNAVLNQLQAEIARQGGTVDRLNKTSPLLTRAAAEVYGYSYPPLLALLWGLTPAIAGAVGRDLLPTYSYLRIYREGDVCRVHSDRPACEHSVSLTLDYSDGTPWDLEVGATHLIAPRPEVADDFGGEARVAVPTAPGDAVLYQGVHRRHGRTRPNPNAWSAHLFLHWVERGGRYADTAFDGHGELTRPANFRFA